MTSTVAWNRKLLASREDLEHAAVLLQQQTSCSPLIDVAECLTGLLVRVQIPKRDFERLVVPTAAVAQQLSTSTSASSTQDKERELRAAYSNGDTFHRIGLLRSLVVHAQPPNHGSGGGGGGASAAAFLLVDLGDAEETYALAKNVCPESAIQSVDEGEWLVFQHMFARQRKSFLTGERATIMERKLQYIRDSRKKDANGPNAVVVSGGTALSGSFAATASSSSVSTHPSHSSSSSTNEMIVAVTRQRETISQLQAELQNKNKELFQMAMRLREEQQAHQTAVEDGKKQVALIQDQNAKLVRDQQERNEKLRPLLEAVKPLNVLLKLAREKLSLPSATPEAVERALREATVIPRQ